MSDEKEDDQILFRLLNFASNSSKQNDQCCDCGLFPLEPDNTFITTPLSTFDFAAFICNECAKVHLNLQQQDTNENENDEKTHKSHSTTTAVHPLTRTPWSVSEVSSIIDAGGNTKALKLLEHHIPKKVRAYRPGPDALTQVRTQWIRAKYHQRLFTVPLAFSSAKAISFSAPPVVLPVRLVDYFVMIGPKSTVKSETSEYLEPVIESRFPIEEHRDCPMMSVMQLVPFCFPKGMKRSSANKAPIIRHFVLTDIKMAKIYGTALIFHDERNLPRCILILSHHPFLSQSSSFLKTLYRISISTSPLPIERYVSNYVSEVPLPPRGFTRVQCSIGDVTLNLERPPVNRLPLVSLGLETLFSLLSTHHIEFVFASLLREKKIVLCSNSYGALTPSAEALLSLLYPFRWQGAYIPLLPPAMIGVVDAPVPFFVGVHRSYLEQIGLIPSLCKTKSRRPRRRRAPCGVIFVDLDEDVIFSDENEENSYVRLTKSEILQQGIPGKDGDKLRRALRKLFSSSSSSSTVTRSFLSYASSHTPDTITPGQSNDPIRRRSGSQDLLESYDLAFHKTIRPVTQFAAKLGVSMSEYNDVVVEKDAATSDGNHHFKKWNTELEDGIRHSFLRVLISLLRDYADFIGVESCSADDDTSNDATVMIFSDQEFLKEFSKKDRRDLAEAIVTSQMFEHYLQDRNMHDSTSKFFDEMIKKKKARSKLSKLNSKSKYATPFLDDESMEFSGTFAALPPSVRGLSEDATFTYGKGFPRVLDRDLIGVTRKPKWLIRNPELSRLSNGAKFAATFTLQCRRRRDSDRNEGKDKMGYDDMIRWVIRVQALVRGWLVRLHVRRRQSIARQREEKARKERHRKHTVIVQAWWLWHRLMTRLRVRARSTLRLQVHVLWHQALKRRLHQVRVISELKRAALVGRFVRGLLQFRLSIVLVQSHLRRKMHARRFLQSQLDAIKQIRQDVFKLWNQKNVSLVRRAVVWNVVKNRELLLTNLNFLKQEMEEVRKKQFGDSKMLVKERKEIADAMRVMQKRGIKFEQDFEAHGLKRDGKKRKRTMVKLLFTKYEWLDASSNVLMKVLENSVSPTLQYQAMVVRTRRANQTKNMVSSVVLGLYRALIFTQHGNGTKIRSRSRMMKEKERRLAEKPRGGLARTKLIFTRQSSQNAWPSALSLPLIHDSDISTKEYGS